MKKKLLILLSICSTITGLNASAQCTGAYTTLPIPAYLQAGYAVTSTERSDALATSTTWHDLTTDLPAGYVTNGTVDYRAQLQAGISANAHVKMPDFPVLIDITDSVGLRLISNSKVLFQPNSKIILKGNAIAHYHILYIRSKTNVTVYFANIRGDRYTHIPVIGSTSEWGHGISIEYSGNINLIKPVVKECNGDGIKVVNTTTSYVVTIEKAILDNNRRNAMTVGSSWGLTINGMIASNTNGTLPEVGIDFEPESSGQALQGIVINDLVTYNNKSTGISIYPRKLLWGQLPVKNVSMTFNNHFDSLSCRSLGITTSMADTFPSVLGGNITFNKPDWKNPRSGIYARITDDENESQCIITMDWGCRPPKNCDLSVAVHSQLVSQYSPNPIPNWIITNCGPDYSNVGTAYSNYCFGSNCLSKKCDSIGPLTSSKYLMDPSQDIEITASPNPFKDIIMVRIKNNQIDKATISICDMSGRLIKEQAVTGDDQSIDLENMVKGMYLLRYSDSIRSKTIKIIKQ